MPSTRDPLLDERFDELAALVRAARPKAPPALRELVRALAEQEPSPEPARRRVSPFRGAALVFAAVLFVGAVAFLGIKGLGGETAREEAGGTADLAPLTTPQGAERGAAADALRGRPPAATESAIAPPPSGTRVQDYRAQLTLRVKDLEALSRATVSAMRTARSLGGFVVSARYERPKGSEGDSYLVVRVPISKVQQAILRFSVLGTVVAQRIAIDDLQQQVNRREDSIAALRGTIAKLQEQLREPTLSDEERAILRGRLANAREELGRATSARDAILERGNLARISLTLTTRDAPNSPPDRPGYVERTLEDAVDVLGKVVAWGLYVLIVASPFLLVAAVALPLERRRRRRAEQRLLERA